ncbi:hypothetical protein DRJ17_01060 [Candidatus Woesearchaeota archaeon]|nr:MAG: hypothetical protein DRJ17_01060 [Candidatus Woesearchaeota archaeon]
MNTKQILDYFEKTDKTLLMQGKHLIGETEAGFFGISVLSDLLDVFKNINLSRFESFADLGSGDGRVVILASVFTKAVGFELDNKLINLAKKNKKALRSKAKFIRTDFTKIDLSVFDVLFINPDKPFYRGLENKLLQEFKGVLIVANPVFLPSFKEKQLFDYPGNPVFIYEL